MVRNHATELNEKKQKCIAGCGKKRGPMRVRNLPGHYDDTHDMSSGSFFCSACSFLCPKSGMCISQHISKKQKTGDVDHTGNDVYYSFNPNILKFGERGEIPRCSSECENEIARAAEEKKRLAEGIFRLVFETML